VSPTLYRVPGSRGNAMPVWCSLDSEVGGGGVKCGSTATNVREICCR